MLSGFCEARLVTETRLKLTMTTTRGPLSFSLLSPDLCHTNDIVGCFRGEEEKIHNSKYNRKIEDTGRAIHLYLCRRGYVL